MKNVFKSVIFITALILTISTADAASRKKKRVKTVKQPTIEQVIHAIDSISRTETGAADSMRFTQPTRTAIYVSNLPTAINRKALSRHYEDKMVRFSETQQEDSLRQACTTVLLMNDTDNMPMAYEGLAQIYATRGDTDNLKRTLDSYERLSSKLPGDPYKNTIAQLREEYDDVLHPERFAERMRGTWVSYDLKSANGDMLNYPYITLDINDINKNTGIYLPYFPGNTPQQEDWDLFSLKTSQYVGGYNGHIEASFGSERLNRGDATFAKAGFESTRKFRADMRGNIAASKGKFGDKLAATAATEITATLLDGLFSSTAQSSKKIAALNLQLDQVSPVVLKGNAEYYKYSVNVNQMNYYQPRPTYSGKVSFVKWESADGVYFIDSKEKIHSVSPISSLDLTRYNETREKFSWKRPKYWIPTAACEVGGAAMMIGGIIMCCDCSKKDANGNQVYDSDGTKAINNGKLVGGIILMLTGEMTMIIPPCLIYSSRVGKRRAAMAELNRENMRRLERKAVMSIQPDIDPANQSLGLNASIRF